MSARNVSPSPSGEGLGRGPPSEKILLARAEEMRKQPTEWEKRLWRHLSSSQLGGFKFRRQAVIGAHICDFFCPAKALAVEVDGDTHTLEKDTRRDASLRRLGVTVIHVTNEDVRGNMEGVLAMTLARLQSLPDRWAGGLPHPNPSPEGEGLEP